MNIMKNKFILAMSLIGLKSQNELLYDFKKMVELLVKTQRGVYSNDVFEKVYEDLSGCECFKSTDHYYRNLIISRELKNYTSEPASPDFRQYIKSIIQDVDFYGYHNEVFKEAISRILRRMQYTDFVKNVQNIYDIVSDEVKKKGCNIVSAVLADMLEEQPRVAIAPVHLEEQPRVAIARARLA